MPAAFTAAGPPFVCTACHTEFASRNALFRHLRSDSTCAAACNLTDADRCPPDNFKKERPAPTLQAAVLAAKRKEKEEPRQQKELQIETRPEAYQAELDAKAAAMEQLFAGCAEAGQLPALEVFASPPEHFRLRAEFDIWRSESGLTYAMYDGRRRRVAVEHYPMGARLMSEKLMPSVLETLRQEEVLVHRLFQVNFQTGLSGDAVVSLLYRTPYARTARRQRSEVVPGQDEEESPDHSIFTAEWQAAAQRLREALAGASVVGHSRGKKHVLGRDWVEEELEVAGSSAPLRYRQPEGGFSQPNGKVAQHMLSWARAVAREDHALVGSSGPPREEDLLELYCGNGNFAIALAPCFRRVFATELVKGALEAARINAQVNDTPNVSFARLSAEELAQALHESRSFHRLEHVDLTMFNLQTVLVDPPRAGLGEQVCSFVAGFQRIVYISCNPHTLREDLDILRESHSIRRIAAFDQFPYTDHLEMGVLLVRRGGALDAA